MAAAASVKDMSSTTLDMTEQGQKLNVRVVNGAVLVDGATVITADVGPSNGVIHVIDTVMLPQEVRAAAGARWSVMSDAA